MSASPAFCAAARTKFPPRFLGRPLIAILALFLCLVTNRGADSAAQDVPARKPFFLPQNPVAAAYVLGRLSNQELIDAPRSEFVYVALLQRKGLEKKYRVEALDGLAQLRKTDALAELLRAFVDLDRKGEESIAIVRDLSSLLLQAKPSDLAGKRSVLERIAADSQLGMTRQIAQAALVTADGRAEAQWQKAEPDEQRLADLLLAVRLIRDPKLRETFYSKIEPLLGKSGQPTVQRAAVAAIAAVPGRETDAFAKLARLVESGTEPAAAIAGLERIPKKSWPKERAEPLLESVVNYLQSIPVAERTETEFIDAMQFASELTSLVPADKAKAANRILSGLGVRVVVIHTVYEQMLYDKTRIVIEAGKPVEIILQNEDVMPHNLVIVAPGAVEEIGQTAEKMGPDVDARGFTYVPDSPKVLQATRLLQLGEKAKLSFTAPSVTGEYGYVCTFPGHWRRMFGTLVVTDNVEEYLASHPEPAEPKITEWKVEDFAPELETLPTGRNLENGRQLFTSLACVQCHKLGPLGYAFGPELTDVFQRWKGNRAGVLGEILDPAKVINDRFRSYSFELKDGESISGIILKEDATSVTLHSGPSDALVQTVPKSKIESRQMQRSSLMPLGLLSPLSKEQILDLLAFIESGGKTDFAGHKH